jgi:hypothetical protein
LTTMYLAGAKNTDSWHTWKGDLQHAFPLDVMMVSSPKLSFIPHGNHLTSVSLALVSTIHFGSLDFTTDRLVHLSLSRQEWDSSTVFIGMVPNGSQSFHTTLEESSDKDSAALGTGVSSGSVGP